MELERTAAKLSRLQQGPHHLFYHFLYQDPAFENKMPDFNPHNDGQPKQDQVDPTSARESCLEFPCIFPIKAMGRADSCLEAVVMEILQRHAPGFAGNNLESRLSSGGKWLSVTARIEATSKSQLDAIYYELSAHELVVYTL
ncbi:MAG: hypothetical protein N838_00130 [Thiohalocapsa sp. PB-PSB1]|jgi:putative lipoic acid-binding regulatory protein|nr:MAG: hypothetical protein N838_00130 [Thiohalocapsa sp. PB-PSB1]